MNIKKLLSIEDVEIRKKKVFLRVDFNVSVSRNKIADDVRMRQALPTISYLLKRKNKLILASHFGQPKKREEKYSLKLVAKHLSKLIPTYKVIFIKDINSKTDLKKIALQRENEIILLENLRFYPGEKGQDIEFAKKLATLADIYVNDAFGVSHRRDTSLCLLPYLLPSYIGLLMKEESSEILKLLHSPQRPFVAIVGGAKISDKIHFLYKLLEIADTVMVCGGLANTFLNALSYEVGKSLCEKSEAENVKKIMRFAKKEKKQLILPSDVIIGDANDFELGGHVVKVEDVPKNAAILDIGPATQAQFGSIIHNAKTVIWNGPAGYCENGQYCRGTDFLYYSIAHTQNCYSLVGGGDTLASISKKEYLDKITHISTGGGATLEFIEKGTLPALEAIIDSGLKKSVYSPAMLLLEPRT